MIEGLYKRLFSGLRLEMSAISHLSHLGLVQPLLSLEFGALGQQVSEDALATKDVALRTAKATERGERGEVRSNGKGGDAMRESRGGSGTNQAIGP